MFKALTGKTYAERLWSRPIEPTGHTEEFGGRELVAELCFRRRRCKLTAVQFPRLAVATRIHKDHGVGVADGFSHLRQELGQLQDFNFGRCQSLAQVASDNPTHA